MCYYCSINKKITPNREILSIYVVNYNENLSTSMKINTNHNDYEKILFVVIELEKIETTTIKVMHTKFGRISEQNKY